LGSSVALEKSLQTLIENNLESQLGVRFLASEYPTGPRQGEQNDTLGINENGYPIIIEYKKATNENVIIITRYMPSRSNIVTGIKTRPTQAVS
jgi:RecB family endonuclease NucS